VTTVPAPVGRARALALVLLALMLGEFVGWHVLRFSAGTALIASLVAVAPWLPLVRGIWQIRGNACLGGMLLTTPYMGYALMEIVANPGARRFAAPAAFLALGLSVALVALLRISRRRAPAPT
jgi:hypothetical protein